MMNMDIVIYTNEKVLEHKKKDGNVYWSFSRKPKNLKTKDRFYFAIKGFVEGSFRIDYIHYDGEVDFISSTWKLLKKKIPTKVFRGFRYKWW